ncbi:MAG: UDP-N-acetyl-D-mannosamine dehydrogenase [Chlamydiae bacterium]|nr:UDP-N-acetyl-D-mannosamine dehydrogenase [Chlamydiota bacterium]
MNHVAVIGLGRIGLPTALVLEKSGFQVIGIDTDESRLNAIKTKALHIDEPDIRSLFKASKISVSNQPTAADIFLICVPTPLTQEKKADLSHLQSAIAMIQPFLTKENLVIIESTCPIGTTDEIASHFPGVYFAYCPERVMPGKLLKELIECDRTIGGVDQKATEKAIEFYSRFCRGSLHKTQAKMAEAVKLAENAYRDVNVALANELSMFARRIGLSDQELIALANCHPRVDILKPGPGVGGHCIPIDPEFLIEAFPKETTLLQAARVVNEQKRIWVEEEIEKGIRQHRCQTIALFGLTYKANISDFRHSPALAIYENLKEKYHVIPIDPFYPEGVPIQNGIKQAEMVVGLVAHDAFRVLDKNSLNGKIILDYAEVFG